MNLNNAHNNEKSNEINICFKQKNATLVICIYITKKVLQGLARKTIVRQRLKHEKLISKLEFKWYNGMPNNNDIF